MNMMKHQAYNVLPVQVVGGDLPLPLQQASARNSASLVGQNVPISSSIPITRRHHHLVHHSHLVRLTTSKLAARRHLHSSHQQQQYNNNHHHHHHHNHHHHHHQLLQRPRVIRASEYKNLRQVVPSLRRQRDVGKVEVVTEAARYIDHLHKTLIERFVLCGIPDSLKDILGTDDANELNSQHIMNLVTKMAAKQQQRQQATRPSVVVSQQRGLGVTQGSATISARNTVGINGIQRTQLRNCARNSTNITNSMMHSRQLQAAVVPLANAAALSAAAERATRLTPPSTNNTTSSNNNQCQRTTPVLRGNVNGCRKSLPIVKRLDTTISNKNIAEDKSKYDD